MLFGFLFSETSKHKKDTHLRPGPSSETAFEKDRDKNKEKLASISKSHDSASVKRKPGRPPKNPTSINHAAKSKLKKLKLKPGPKPGSLKKFPRAKPGPKPQTKKAEEISSPNADSKETKDCSSSTFINKASNLIPSPENKSSDVSPSSKSFCSRYKHYYLY